jgi:hypothetical protein
MGLQVVWTHYARAIFEERVSTLITDARILSINLFHACLLNELQENNNLIIAKDRFNSWKSDRDVRFGLLILLEDILTHVFYEQIDKGTVELGGLIGMVKAGQVHRAKSEIRLRAEQKSGILINQIQLGMMGRNKGGMISMGLLNGDLVPAPDLRGQFQELFHTWPGAHKLKESLKLFIIEVVLKAAKNRDFPELHYESISLSDSFLRVSKGYTEVFGKRQLPLPLREFWIDRLGFRCGAAQAIYETSGALYTEGNPADPHRIMLQASKTLAAEPGEQDKIDIILRLEPFLSLAEFVFRFINQKDVRRIADFEPELSDLRKQLEADGSPERLKLEVHSVHPRLKKLLSVMIVPGQSLNDWIAGIIQFHKEIMEMRKNSSWLEIQPGGNLRHIQYTSLPEELNKASLFLKKRPWFHRYYVDSVQSLRELLTT